VGDSIVPIEIYKGCMVSIFYKEILLNSIELDRVDLDVILGMDWLHSCYASRDCRARRVSVHFPNDTILELVRSSLFPKWEFISYFKSQKIISKGFRYHSIMVRDSNSGSRS